MWKYKTKDKDMKNTGEKNLKIIINPGISEKGTYRTKKEILK